MPAVQSAVEPIWAPAAEDVSRTQLAQFINFCQVATGDKYLTSTAFQEFSVRDYPQFWRLFLDWARIPWTGDASTACTDGDIEHAAFFPGVTLNYAEILLAGPPDLPAHLPAIVSCHPDRPPGRITRGELRRRVAAAALALQELGIGPGSRIAVVARNDADAVVGVLAGAAVGATIATASPDAGAPATLNQLSQVEPVALLCHLDSPFATAREQVAERIEAIVEGLPSLRCVVVLDHGAPRDGLAVPVFHLMERAAFKDPDIFVWRHLPFNHPLFILFTSGTTGRPKCIVHGAGGTLVEHLKEHRLHCDLRPGDTLFFQTSTAWMMWHWQLSALASGVEIVLNAAPVTSPKTLWQIVADHQVTVLGTSPAYLQLCEGLGYRPADHQDLRHLRAVLSTGSVLFPRHQEWLTRNAKHLPIQSMSGGSDIIGCFVLGSPMVPAYPAECMSRSLGLDVQAFVTSDAALPPNAGELVCANPFPSRPLGFLNDPDGMRFYNAYFAKNPGVWTHGDLIEVTPHGSVRMLGRSDSVMNIRGIRIGPAELYGAIAEIDEVQEALAVEKSVEDVPGNAVIVLVVVLRAGVSAGPALFDRIARTIGRKASAAHVPTIIMDVPELPMTHSGKLSERSVHDVVNGRPAVNVAALRNPGCLAVIADHPALRRRPNVVSEPTRSSGDDPAASLRGIWEGVLDRRPIGPHEDFFSLGGDSLAAISLLAAVEQTFAVALPVTTIYEAPTIAAMADLIETEAPLRFNPLVRIKNGDGRAAVFIVHGIGGNVMELVGLGRRIQAHGAVYAVQARGLNGEAPPAERVGDMARDYLGAIRDVQPHGPYHLAGYSFGGLVAFEMARLLRSEGETVGFLGILDSTLHERNWPAHVWVTMILRSMRVHVRELRKLPFSGVGHYAKARLTFLRGHLSQRFGSAAHDRSMYSVTGLPPALQAVRNAAVRAFAEYRPGFYDGTVTLIRSEKDDPKRCDPVISWRRQAGRLRVLDVPGNHADLVLPPVVDIVAGLISASLAETASGSAPSSEPTWVPAPVRTTEPKRAGSPAASDRPHRASQGEELRLPSQAGQ